jgi:hypothetical protein
MLDQFRSTQQPLLNVPLGILVRAAALLGDEAGVGYTQLRLSEICNADLG